MGTAPLIQVRGVDGVKTKAPMSPRFNEVSVHPILTAPGDIKKADKTKLERARRRHNAGGVLEKCERGRDSMNLRDMRVTSGAQRGGEVSSRDTSVESPIDGTRHSKDYSGI